jgi:hypothetical protein
MMTSQLAVGPRFKANVVLAGIAGRAVGVVLGAPGHARIGGASDHAVDEAKSFGHEDQHRSDGFGQVGVVHPVWRVKRFTPRTASIIRCSSFDSLRGFFFGIAASAPSSCGVTGWVSLERLTVSTGTTRLRG